MKTRQQIKSRLGEVTKSINSLNKEGVDFAKLADFMQLKEIKKTLEWVLDKGDNYDNS